MAEVNVIQVSTEAGAFSYTYVTSGSTGTAGGSDNNFSDSNATFQSDDVRPGDKLQIGSSIYTVLQVISETALTTTATITESGSGSLEWGASREMARVSVLSGADEVTISWMANESGTFQFQVGSPPVSLHSRVLGGGDVDTPLTDVIDIDPGDLDEGANVISIVKV